MLRNQARPVPGEVRDDLPPGFTLGGLLAAAREAHVPVFAKHEEPLMEFPGMVVRDFGVVLEPDRDAVNRW